MRQFRAIVLLPGTVTLIVPAMILWGTDSFEALPYASKLLSVMALLAAVGLLASGLVLWLRTVALFSQAGKGTLAPWDPPERLVVRGIYRYVRNPMISGVCFFLAGEAVLFGSHWLAAWLLFFTALNMVYIPLVEEPGLVKRFGEDYEMYRRNVRSWIPRTSPWELPRDGSAETYATKEEE